MMVTTHRLLAIGDIHGYRNKLNDLLGIVRPTATDQVIFIGDYIDRGPDSRGVISRLIAFGQEFPQTVFIRGNHEEMLLDLIYNPEDGDEEFFQRNGGEVTLSSYGGALHKIPQQHLDFIKGTQLYYQHRATVDDPRTGESREQDFLFVHAGIKPNVPLEQQNRYALMEIRGEFLDSDKPMGETIVVHGHTFTKNVPSNAPYRIVLDSGVYLPPTLPHNIHNKLGLLTCCNVLTRQIWQV